MSGEIPRQEDDLTPDQLRAKIEASGPAILDVTQEDGQSPENNPKIPDELKKLQADVDLVIVDVVMPYKNGKEVYTAVKNMSPDMKLLFMSGYTGDVVFDKGVLDTDRNFIAKPFAPGDLVVKVREMLDE